MEKNREKFRKKYIAGLDGLRGFAVLGVTLYHMFPQQIKGGFLGVSLFFVLSGYLLAVTGEREIENSKFQIRTFYQKRILRIYPALLIVIAMVVVGLKFFIKVPMHNIQEEVLSIIGGYNNWWQIGRNSSYFTKVSGTSGFIHLWSLAVEIQFYIIWPLLFWIYRKIVRKSGKNKGMQFFLVLALMSLLAEILQYRPEHDVTRVYYGTDTRVYALLFGSLLGFMKMDPGKRIREKIKPLTVIFITCMVLVIALFVFADGQSPFTYWIFLPVSCLLFLVIIGISAISALPFGRILGITPLALLGKYSYEIYLCQYPVSFVFRLIHKGNYTVGQMLSELLVVFGVSLLLHHSIRSWRKRGRQKNKILLIGAAALLITGMCFVLGKTEESTKQSRLWEELQENAAMLATQEKQQEDAATLTQQETETNKYTFIGDSVMLGAAAELKNAIQGCIVEAAESRQVWDAVEIVKQMKEKGELGNCVIIGLGANGSFDKKSGQELIDAIGKERKVYWIYTYGKYMTWQEDVNEMIQSLTEDNTNLTVLDWVETAQEHPEWFYDDGMHLNSIGQTGYADFIIENF